MARVFTGAKAVIFIDEKPIAFAGGVNVNQEDTLTDVEVLGQISSADLAETGHKVSCSVNMFKSYTETSTPDSPASGSAIANTANSFGAMLSGIDDDGDLAIARNRTEFSISIVDETTGSIIYRMEGCKCEGGSGQVDARGLWQGTWNFKARRGFGL